MRRFCVWCSGARRLRSSPGSVCEGHARRQLAAESHHVPKIARRQGLEETYLEIVQFGLVGAPNGVIEAVIVSDDADCFVRVVPHGDAGLGAVARVGHARIAVGSHDALGDGEAPVLDRDVLLLGGLHLLEGKGQRVAVTGAFGEGLARKRHDGRCDVGVRRDCFANMARRDARSALFLMISRQTRTGNREDAEKGKVVIEGNDTWDGSRTRLTTISGICTSVSKPHSLPGCIRCWLIW